MPEKLTLEWLKEMISHEIQKAHKSNSMLLESPYNEEEQPDPGVFAEIGNMLNGRSAVSTIVIMTPENPLGKKISDEENAERREQFELAMQKAGQQLIPIIGKYGAEENSYILPGMSREGAIEHGSDFDQDSVIYGEKKKFPEGDAIEFQMIYTSKGTEYDTDAGLRYVAVSGEEADSRNDLFSKYKGVKFFIPFYEPEYEGVYPWDLNEQPEPEEAPNDEVSIEQ
jgi:hypothetical protein